MSSFRYSKWVYEVTVVLVKITGGLKSYEIGR
jgi:hypothetical protein